MPNISTYIPTYVNLDLSNGYIAIYDNNGVQQYYQNADETIELPYYAVATQWSYKIAKHGYKLITGTFIIDPVAGGIVFITPSYVIDNAIVNTDPSSVSAYTRFYTTQNIYDYFSYYRTTSVGLSYGDLIQYASGLTFLSNYNLVINSDASPAFTFNGSTFTINSTALSGANISTTGNILLSGSVNIANISLTTNVLSSYVTPYNLTNVNVYGNMYYNSTAALTNLTYINSNITRLGNNNAGGVLIKKVNSSITTITNPVTAYISTFLSLNLLGGYIAIYDDLGVQQFYQNTDAVIELPYSANGTWTYKIAKYGYKLITGSFTVNRTSGGTVIIAPVYSQDIYISDTVNNVSAYNAFYTTQNIYDYFSYYRTTNDGLNYGDQNLYSSSLNIGSNNIIFNDLSPSPFSYNGNTYILKSPTLSGASITTTGSITLSGASSISNITLAASALDNTPNDLTNVNIQGTLIYNTNTPASIVYTNTTVSTVVNNGTATILIKRINSNINNASDPEIENYAPTLINVTPTGGSIGIYNSNGNRQYFLTSNSSLVLPASANGTWSFKVAKYGYYAITEYFTIDRNTGATINITPNYVTDLFITEPNVSNVSAYGALNTAAMIHDYLSYNQTLQSFIDYGDLESESFGTLTFTGGLILDATATDVVSVSSNGISNIVTLKSTNFVDSITLVAAGDFVQKNGNTISSDVKVRSANYDSEIYFASVNEFTIYASASDRDGNINPRINLNNASIYRYKYGSTVNGVLFTGTIYARVNTGGTILLVNLTLQKGSSTIDYGVVGNLQAILNNQKTINTGVQKASILVPHSTNI